MPNRCSNIRRQLLTDKPSGEVLPAVNVIELVPCPVAIDPFVTFQTSVAPAVGLTMLALALPFAQTDGGAEIEAFGGAQVPAVSCTFVALSKYVNVPPL